MTGERVERGDLPGAGSVDALFPPHIIGPRMTRTCTRLGGPMVRSHRTFAGISIVVGLAVVIPWLLAGHWLSIRGWAPMGITAFVDRHDIGVYFASSVWVAGGAPLYGGSPSEYPLAANLIFAAVRVVSEAWQPLPDSAASFELTWVILGWWMWLVMLVALWRWAPRRAVWLWLTPAALYFTLYRFDVYPVAATLAALVVARRGRLLTASLLLGLAIGLKGYALFAVPALAVWVWYERGWRTAGVAVVLAVAPLAASMLLVGGMGGLDAALYPFRVQASRGSNGESSWDVVAFLFGRRDAHPFLERFGWLPFALEVATALLAAALRPRSFQGFLRSFIVGVGGFVTFSVFYSPQFYLWFVPPVALADSVAMLASTTVLGWVTIVYFPLGYFRGRGSAPFRLAVAAVTVLRTTVIAIAIAGLLSPRQSRPPDGGVPEPSTPSGSSTG